MLREEPVAAMAKCPLLQLLTFWAKEPTAVRTFAAEAAHLEAGHYTARDLLQALTRALQKYVPVRAEYDNLLRQGTARFHGMVVVGRSLGLLARDHSPSDDGQVHASRSSAGRGKRQAAQPEAAKAAQPKAAQRKATQPKAAQAKAAQSKRSRMTARRPASSLRGALRESPASFHASPASVEAEFALLRVGHGGQAFRAQADETALLEAVSAARRFAAQLSTRPAGSPSELWGDLKKYAQFLKSLPKHMRLGGGYQTCHFLRKRLQWLLTEEVRQSTAWKKTSFRLVAEISADQQGALSSLPEEATIETVEEMLGVDAHFVSMWACLLREPLRTLPPAWHFLCAADVTLVTEQLVGYKKRHGLAPSPYVLLEQCIPLLAGD